jgi:hypothetical protein
MVSDRYHLLGVLQNLLRRRSLLRSLLQCPLYFRCHRPNPLLLPCSHTHRNLAVSRKSGRRSWSRLMKVPILSDPTTPQDVAYRWLRNDDPLQTGPFTYATVEQRYALATRQLSIIWPLETVTSRPTMNPDWLRIRRMWFVWGRLRLGWFYFHCSRYVCLNNLKVEFLKCNRSIAFFFVICFCLASRGARTFWRNSPRNRRLYSEWNLWMYMRQCSYWICLWLLLRLVIPHQVRYQATRPALLNQVSVPHLLPSRRLRSYFNSPHRCLL